MANHTPKNYKAKIAKVSGNCCNYCGADRSEKKLTLDHIIPRCMGGSTEITNCQLLCKDCHNRKSQIEQAAMAESLTNQYKVLQ